MTVCFHLRHQKLTKGEKDILIKTTFTPADREDTAKAI